MEDLRSTDILDKEIQNDARKKAHALLDPGKQKAAELLNRVSERLEAAKEQKEKFYGAKEEKIKKDSDASLPLEKERFLVSFIGTSINQGIEDYLKNLSSAQRLQLVTKLLDGKEDLVKDKKFSAKVCGFDKKEAQEAVEKKLGSKLLSCETVQNVHDPDGIVLESEDRGVKIRLTIEEIIGAAKDKHYQEMCSALFGGRL
ncbi:MAG: hypothetical protein J6X95_04330 [Treponema sp.]|nr:hypothetical protein [Treponema sp.]